ncbi:MAG: hypothetical protein KDN19_20850 [Verrucomicrobiae bacterium]|nr:hypothetical protein [Verrucomicrobiae bacterium]
MDETISGLSSAIYRDKVLRARQLSVAERLETGIELFEGAVGMMRDGIRHQFPAAGPEEVEEILRRRLKRLRQVEERGLFRAVN